jgi:hypothetical protein
LIRATETGPPRSGMSGPDRAVLYLVASETGFRAGELHKTTWDCVRLDADPPAIKVTSKSAKNKREHAQPLKVSTARLLAGWRDSSGATAPNAPVFPTMPRIDRLAAVVRADMQAAGLPLCDADRRERGFHSFRHSFVSSLLRSGVPLKLAMDLARHSDPRLTSKRYGKTLLPERVTAIENLPALTSVATAVALRATGTYDSATPSGISSGISNSGASRRIATDTGCTEGSARQHDQRGEGNNVSAEETGTSRRPLHRSASPEKRRGGDSNPRYANAHTGFRNQPLQPLGHLSTLAGPGHGTPPSPSPPMTKHLAYAGAAASPPLPSVRRPSQPQLGMVSRGAGSST